MITQGSHSGVALSVDACKSLVTSDYWTKRIDQRDGSSCTPFLVINRVTGYGICVLDGRSRLAHRVAWTAWAEREIAPGMVIDHLCRNRRCVNPVHLRETTQQRNLSTNVRAISAAEKQLLKSLEILGASRCLELITKQAAS